PPYHHIYLISQRDKAGNNHLSYKEDSPDCALLTMGALSVAASLLGLHDLRRERLANHITNNRIHQTFLTGSIRGVSYPKYEIPGAAACRISARLCENWFSREACCGDGRPEPLQKDEISKRGRESWNAKIPAIWVGLRGAINISELSHRIKAEK